MTEAKLEKQKKTLVELGVMDQEDTLVHYLQANYVEQLLGKFGQWKRGWAYFTQQRLVVITGLLDENIIIPYDSIRDVQKCSQGLFPMGIAITYEKTPGVHVTNKISLAKRNDWIAFLQEKAGI